MGSVSYDDAAGNLTGWNGAAYTYDRLHQMWRMVNGTEDWLYLYSADGERIWPYSTAGKPSRWTPRDLDGKVLREYQTAGGIWTIQRDYVYRGSQLLAAHTADAAPKDRLQYHVDHLGTPRAITDKNGTRIAYHVYYPFGEEATSATQDVERAKFTGHERDLGNTTSAADDLDYMHARFYNPQTGRFLGVDPIKGGPRPQSWNRYGYTLSNPMKYIDPDGRTVIGFMGFLNQPGGITEVIEALQPFEDAVGPSRVFRHQDSFAGMAFLLGNQGGTLNALIGHSLGAYAALSSAKRLNQIGGGVPIDLLATVDAAPNFPGRTTVPPNVALAINFFQGGADLGGTQLVAEDPSKTRVLNIEIRSAGHTQIDAAVASAIVGEILNLAADKGAEISLKKGLQLIQGELIYVRE